MGTTWYERGNREREWLNALRQWQLSEKAESTSGGGGTSPSPAHPILQQPDVPERVERIASTVALRQGVPLKGHDLADCAQHAWEALIPAFHRFDPRRGDGASLLTRVVTNATKRWLTRRVAQMRDCRREVSLPSRSHHEVDWGREGRTAVELVDGRISDRERQRLLADDLWAVVRSMPSEQRAVIIALLQHGREHAAARRWLGWSRERYDSVRERVCRALRNADLGDVI